LKSYPSGPQNVTVFGDRVVKEVVKLKIRSLGWTITQYDWCLYKKRKFEHKRVQKGDLCEDTERRSPFTGESTLSTP
jgi:hypothetical protein